MTKYYCRGSELNFVRLYDPATTTTGKEYYMLEVINHFLSGSILIGLPHYEMTCY